MRQEPGGTIVFLLCYFDLALQHTVVVGVQVIELQVSLAREETVSFLGAELLDLLVSRDELSFEGKEMLPAGLNHDRLLVDGRELCVRANIHLQNIKQGWLLL